MKKKLTSRKFLLSLLTALIVVANGWFDLGLSMQEIGALVATVSAYVLGEAVVDMKHNGNGS